jgi:hypothetical protein
VANVNDYDPGVDGLIPSRQSMAAKSKLKVIQSAAEEPLLAALLARLPGPGQPFPADKRANWLRMWEMALDDLYGVTDELFYPPADAPKQDGSPGTFGPGVTIPMAKPQPALPFYIDPAGYARRSNGAPINPQDAAGATIYDQRGEAGDLRAIIWADGRTGVAGLQLDIAAA